VVATARMRTTWHMRRAAADTTTMTTTRRAFTLRGRRLPLFGGLGLAGWTGKRGGGGGRGALDARSGPARRCRRR
jgi:hypothetical protein